MRSKLLAAVFLLFTVNSALAQNLEILNPPTSGTGFNDLFGYQGDPVNLLAEPHVNGIVSDVLLKI